MNLSNETKTLLIEAVIAGIIWAVMFYYVRKGLNKRNFMGPMPDEKKLDFWYDGLYGGLAALLSVIAKKFVTPMVMNAV